MNNPTKASSDVGVIIGRFQVHKLHEAHLSIIEKVKESHDKVIVLLGLSPLRNTINNPLDFRTRKAMFQESYPDIDVYYIEDMNNDKRWSERLDMELKKILKPFQSATLYGGRDSFIPFYSGKYPTKELETTSYISGTEIRRRIANSYPSTEEFRAGVIAASLDRYPTCYPTVDVAIIDNHRKRVLMGKKPNEHCVRFIGGFADPESESYEVDARREVMEEAGSNLSIDAVQYIGSRKIDDWRYRKEADKIKTLFFTAVYLFGRPEAGDDIESVEWVLLDDLFAGKVNVMPEHLTLVDMLKAHMIKDKDDKAPEEFPNPTTVS